MRLDQSAIPEQFLQRVGKALGLKKLSARDGAASAHDGVAGADQNIGAAVDRTGPLLEFAGEAIVHAAKMRFLGLAQIEVGKQPPKPDGSIAYQRLLDAAEPANELGGEAARNPVGEQKVDVLLLHQAQQLGADRHGTVNSGA
jgi:hypothetical protein